MTKSAGTLVHALRSNVAWRVVGLLSAGSVPAAIATLVALSRLGPHNGLTAKTITIVLGFALLLTSLLLVFRRWLLAMLLSLGVGRYITAVALEWLHFPSWRERYKAHYARQQQGLAGAYYPLPNVYQRLRGLRDGGLIQTIVRRTDQASLAYGRLPDVFALTERGAELVASRLDVDMDSLAVEIGRQRALQNLEHGVAIGRVYAALRCAAEHRQQAKLASWLGDHLLARPQSYDRVVVRGHREPLPVQPDGTALLVTNAGERRLFLELDRELVCHGRRIAR